jgi:F-type H+-transporting ATPase subunit gamma
MSVGLAKTKRRIRSIESTEKTTKAMELIAMVKLRRLRSSLDQEKLYSDEYTSLMSLLFAYNKKEATHYGHVNKGADKSLYIVISSNLGLCGAYNNNLFRFVEGNVDPSKAVLAPIGRKAIHHFGLSQNYETTDRCAWLDLSTDPEKIRQLCSDLKDDFNSGRYRAIYVVYTRYVNSLTFIPTIYQLLPVQIPRKKWEGEEYCPPLFDEDPKALIHALLPGYLSAVLYDRLLESELSEQASRRTAMDNANDNADELLAKLRIEYNKDRQNAITQEITEVVGGSM